MSIPKSIKTSVWNKYAGKKSNIKCQCCTKESISVSSFKIGKQDKIKGNVLANLRVICFECSKYTTKSDINTYRKKFGVKKTTPKKNNRLSKIRNILYEMDDIDIINLVVAILPSEDTKGIVLLCIYNEKQINQMINALSYGIDKQLLEPPSASSFSFSQRNIAANYCYNNNVLDVFTLDILKHIASAFDISISGKNKSQIIDGILL